MDSAYRNNPPGWNYNPWSWSDRFPILALSLTGLGIGVYQLHVIDEV